MAAVESLFRTYQLNALHLPNRVVMAPMTRFGCSEGVPGPNIAAYYGRRALDGIALIISEGVTIEHPTAANDFRTPQLWGDAALTGWQEVVTQVHAAGGRIAAQLWHVGAVRSGGVPNPELPPSSPSGFFDSEREVGPALDVAGIHDLVEAFGRGAATAKKLGFDAVEIHGGHGYLVDQFLWSVTNRRKDNYGGGIRARSRFAADIIGECRRSVGSDFPVIFRLSQWKAQDFSAKLANSPQELAELLEPLVDAGVDAIHCSTRRFWEPEFADGDLNLAAWAKKLTGKTTITVGSVGLKKDMVASVYHGEDAEIQNLDAIAQRLERDEYDLVAVGRGILADPQWLTKVAAGRVSDLLPFKAEKLAIIY